MFFLDTNILLNSIEEYKNNQFVISSVTLHELEDIKTSTKKDEGLKYKAREVSRFLYDNPDSYNVVIYNKDIEQILHDFQVEDTPDNRICASAYWYNENNDNIVFVTEDIYCGIIAKQVFGLSTDNGSKQVNDNYTGFKEIKMDDDGLLSFLENGYTENIYNLKTNEYLIIDDENNDATDALRWNGSSLLSLYKRPITSIYFDKLKPKDVYQMCVIDSIMNNTITAISGKPGSGKSLISLACAMSLIENRKFDRLVLLFNPCKTRGAADMGAYTGSAYEKSLQNSIGQILTTKFGDRMAIDYLIQQDKIKLVSLGDCRGMEIRDNEILYMTECQNTTIDLMKLALSRVSSGAKVIIEGDWTTQVDSYLFEGNNNGLKRVVDAFQGHEEFGYIQLQNVWRSRIAELCELL